MPPDNPNEIWIAMRHPNVDADDAAVATRAAFDEVWADKGWRLVAGSESRSQDLVDVTAGRKAPAKSGEKGV